MTTEQLAEILLTKFPKGTRIMIKHTDPTDYEVKFDIEEKDLILENGILIYDYNENIS